MSYRDIRFWSYRPPLSSDVQKKIVELHKIESGSKKQKKSGFSARDPEHLVQMHENEWGELKRRSTNMEL